MCKLLLFIIITIINLFKFDGDAKNFQCRSQSQDQGLDLRGQDQDHRCWGLSHKIWPWGTWRPMSGLEDYITVSGQTSLLIVIKYTVFKVLYNVSWRWQVGKQTCLPAYTSGQQRLGYLGVEWTTRTHSLLERLQRWFSDGTLLDCTLTADLFPDVVWRQWACAKTWLDRNVLSGLLVTLFSVFAEINEQIINWLVSTARVWSECHVTGHFTQKDTME